MQRVVRVQCAISRDELLIPFNNSDSLSASSDSSVVSTEELKRKIRDETGFRLDMMELIRQGEPLLDTEPLDNELFISGEFIRLEIRTPKFTPHPSQKSYDGFLRHTQFLDSAGNELFLKALSPSLSIALQFRPDKFSSKLDLQSLVDRVDSNDIGSMQQTFGFSEAKRRGFVQWTSHEVYERILLLEGDICQGCDTAAAAKAKLENIRYCYDGINQLYSGGDKHSWQRYTKHIPIPTDIRVDNDLSQILITPREPLKPDKEYFILLMHGGRVLDKAILSENDYDTNLDISINSSLNESKIQDEDIFVLSDHLIYFRVACTDTEKTLPMSNDSWEENKIIGSADSMENTNQEIEFSVSQSYANVPQFTLGLNAANLKCMDLKNAIFEYLGLSFNDQQLMINGVMCLDDDTKLSAYHLLRHSSCPSSCNKHVNRIHLIPVIPPFRNNMTPSLLSKVCFSLSPYIRSVFPHDGTANVSTHVMIHLQFQTICTEVLVSSNGAYNSVKEGNLKLRSQANLSTLSNHRPEAQATKFREWNWERDMEISLGTKEARRRGFMRWKDARSNLLHRHFFLLEVNCNDVETMQSRRYGFCPWRGKNGSYWGGDSCSWQRYTAREPLAGKIEVNSDEQSVIFRPDAPLRQNTTYAVVLTNGVHIVSRLFAKNSANSCESVMYNKTEEDFLSFFSTAPTRSLNDSSHGSGLVDSTCENDGGHVGMMCYGISDSDSMTCSVS